MTFSGFPLFASLRAIDSAGVPVSMAVEEATLLINACKYFSGAFR